ncbi:hypothetical protein [Blastomonas sp. CCH2-A2]|uniref:hypothetical protein n=1 Tax=Blastomonas sp. CCH2-A2 TaxID=1768788 RepID=UPI0012E39380|nr:hypothetical protein [Blastomonas sp. CCH2-A2]
MSRFEKESSRLQLVAEVDTAALGKDVLSLTYAGTTGIEGGADLKDRPRPWVLGHVKGIEPVQIDVDNSVFQVSGYGPIGSISALYERGSSFGDPMADHADYAALVAATIPPGRWATCLAQGLFRLGAPPFGVITADVEGHKVGSVVPRRTGAIIRTVAAAIGIASGSIDAASMDALDAAVARNVGIYLTEQETFIDLAQRMCLPCNAYSGMSWQGEFFAVRPVFGSAALTLHGQGRADPQVLRMVEGGVNPPFKKTIFGADKCWRVHSTTDIAYQDILVDRGRYQAGETYRAGNIVDLTDGSRWLYIADTATSGNAPQAGSAFWELISDQVQPVYLDGTPMEDLKPAEPGATEGGVIPTPGSGVPGNIKDETGAIRDPGELLNSQIEQTASGRLQYRPLPDADPIILGEIKLPDLGAASQVALRQAEDDIDQVGRALATVLDEASRTRETLRDAGFYVDPANGQIRIHAIEQTRERVSLAEININAAQANINLKASVNYVDEQIALAVIDPSQIADLTAIFARLTTAEADIDGLNAEVSLLATAAELSTVEARITTAETAIDALEGEITTKVSTTTFDLLETRVTNAETTLTAIGDVATISNAVSAARLLEKAADANAEQDLRSLLRGDAAKREYVAAIASARNELGARITEEGAAQASFAQALQVRVGDAEASILSESLTRASADSALAVEITELAATLNTEVGNLEAAVETEQQARVEADGLIAAGLAQQVTAGRVLEGEASALVEQLLGALLINDKNRREIDGALAGARQEITAQVVSLSEVFATSVLALVARAAENEASIIQESVARVTADESLASTITSLNASFTGALSAETIARTNAVTTLEGDIGNAIGRIDDEEIARAAGDAANADALDDAVTTLTASITAEAIARADEDGALAGQITTLSTTVGENTATLVTYGESIDGLEARGGIRFDINGRISGVGVTATADTTKMTPVVDAFELVDPDTGFAYLTADEDGLRLQNGKIVLDTGTNMKVQGLGFGTSNQFVSWYGPTRALNLCDEASAYSYEKVDGSAYFGGSLSAGVIRNSARTTDITNAATITIGPFGTNGEPILVVTSYGLISGQTIAYPATTAGLDDWEEAVTLWGATATGTNPNRAVNATKAISCSIIVETDGPLGASSSPFSTLTISGGTETLVGTAPIVGDSDGVLVYTRTISGSVTATDNSGGTANRTFIATLTTRTDAVLGTIQSQTISLTATEE